MNTHSSIKNKSIISKIAQCTGWRQFKVKRIIAEAQKSGISPEQYLEYRCWELKSDELARLSDRLRKEKQSDEEVVSALSRIIGCSLDEAASKIDLVEKSGLPLNEYIAYEAFDLSDENLMRLARAYKAAMRRRSDFRNYAIDAIMHRSDWTRTYVIRRLDEARDIGVDFDEYLANSCWDMDESQLNNFARICNGLKGDFRFKQDECVDHISMETGWAKGEVALNVLETYADSGCSIEDYARCRMWDKRSGIQRTYLNREVWEKFRIDSNCFDSGLSTFSRRDIFKDVFSSLISRRCFLFDDMGKGEFFEMIKGLNQIAVKNLSKYDDSDTLFFSCNESYLQNGELYKRLIGLKRPLIIEEKVQQCQTLNDLSPESLNILRVITLRRNRGTRVLSCTLCCGVIDSRGDFHPDALLVEVDPETGACLGDAVDHFGNLVAVHPNTGIAFNGFGVPNIEDVLVLAEQASEAVPEYELVSWEIAVSQSGADLMSGTLQSNYNIVQLAHLAISEEGLRPSIVDPYVNLGVIGSSYIEEIARQSKDASTIDSSRFRFSVVVPILKGDVFAQEAIESVLRQTISFEENIQVIFVNGGSSDESAIACQEYEAVYPDNVIYIEESTDNLSALRNVGLRYVEGALVGFLNPDDKWADNAFELVWRFLESHKGEVDVIGCRVGYFGNKKGFEPLDYRFKGGDRIVEIAKSPDCMQIDVSSAFIALSALKNRFFDERIPREGGSKLLVEVVLDKRCLGLLESALYYHRKYEDRASAELRDGKVRIFPTLKYYYSFAVDLSLEKFGRVVPYIQHCLLNGLKSLVDKPLSDIDPNDNEERYREMVVRLFEHIDYGVLFECRNATPSLKLYMVQLKGGEPVKRLTKIDDGAIWFNGAPALKITGNRDVCLSQVDLSDESLLVEGVARVPGFAHEYGLFCEAGSSIIEIDLGENPVEEKIGMTGEMLSKRVPFSFRIAPEDSEFEVRMFANYDGDVLNIPISITREGVFASVRKGVFHVGRYAISRPDRLTLFVKRD